MDVVNVYINDLSKVDKILEEEEKLLAEMNADLDKQVQKDMEEIFVIPDSPTKEPEPDQDMDEDESIYKTMNEELDKQVAKDMEAIQKYISNKDDSLSKRIEFFNNIDNSHINRCIDRHVSNHILVQHTVMGTIKWHECTQCDYKVKNKASLREHILQKHTGLGDTNWVMCPHCTFLTRKSADLQKHLLVVHKENAELGHKCDRCNKTFTEEKYLFEHKRDTHGDEVFSCKQCEFQTLDSSDLMHHSTQHLKLNFSWYKCAQCSYRTVRKTNLDRHVMYKHSLF